MKIEASQRVRERRLKKEAYREGINALTDMLTRHAINNGHYHFTLEEIKIIASNLING